MIPQPDDPHPAVTRRTAAVSRRTLLRTAALALPAAALAACAALPNPLGGTQAIVSKPVTLNLYYGPFFVAGGGNSPESNLMAGIVQAYQKAQPNVTINATEVNFGFFQDFQVIGDPSSPQHADVLIGQQLGQFRNFNTATAVVPLDSYLQRENEVTMAAFFPAALHLWNRAGHQLGLPRDIEPSDIIYYNRTLLKGAGMSDPPDGWSTDDFVQYLSQLSTGLAKYPANKAQHWAFVDSSQTTSFRDFIQIFGGRQTNYPAQPPRAMYDTSQAIDGAQYYVDLYLKYHLAPDSISRAGVYSSSVLPDFLEGNVPLMLAPSNLIPTIQGSNHPLDWDITLMPIKTDVKQSWNATGTGAFLMKASNIPDVGWDVIKFLVAGQGMTLRAAQGDIHPANIKIAGSDAIPANKAPLGKRLFNSIGMTQMIDVDPATLPPEQSTPGPQVNISSMNRNLNFSLDDMIAGKVPVPDTMRSINQQANASIQ